MKIQIQIQIQRMEHLEKQLQLLPLLGERCDFCERAGVLVEHLAVVRDPQSGCFLCPSCAWLLAKTRLSTFADLSQAVDLRRHFHAHPTKCIDCRDQAERICTHCGEALCYRCGYQVPRTGRACYVCHCLAAAQAAERETELMYIEA